MSDDDSSCGADENHRTSTRPCVADGSGFSKTKSQTAMTAHGDVEYDTVSCKNCGNEVLTDDAVFVGTGLCERPCSRSICSTTHETYRESVPLCEFCSKETVGYTGSMRDKINKPTTSLGYLTVVVAAVVGFAFGAGVVINLVVTSMIISVLILAMIPIVIVEMTES